MDRADLRAMIATLDSEVPREGAQVRLHQYGGGPDEGQIIATEGGFLRLGIELLKAAVAPVDREGQPSVSVDIGYLITDDSTIRFDWFERRDCLESYPVPEALRFLPAVVISALVTVLALAVVGFFAVVRWLLS